MSEISDYGCSPKVSSDTSTGALRPASAAHLWGMAEVKTRLKEAATALRALGLNSRDRPRRI
jgi:hypothetical protein